ncbi:hypothetical protein CAEBREN_24481 [Caenorhabditis brenneri]|uniref:Uncharacterized protein n=1 Tax=Caenorhabditis brenneri TaxID=135651 RepID=G0N2F3_CAEBE|nr:hypothetical protein CAEBREN_24481 [Caenorhabditis brenneri]
MSRPFRPYAKIPVNISFKSYDRPKKVVWDRGFIKVVDDGEWVELSSFWKDHANLPIERLYQNKLRGSDVRPYIFTIRLDANHPENEGQKLIRLNFNGNREGYQHALNSINNAFETFAWRLRNQAKKRPRPQNDEQVVQNSKKKKNEEKKQQEKSLGSEKAAENLPVKKACAPNSRSDVAIQLLRPPPPKPHSWVSEFDRLLGGPEKVSPPKVNNPYEEIRLAEIRRRNDLKLEQRRKERAEKRKAERPTPEVEVIVVKKEVVVEKEVQAKQQKNKLIGAENSSVVKQLEDPEKTKKPVRTVLYDFSKEKDHPLNTTSKLEISLSPDAKPSRKHPIDVRKRLALRQGSVVKQGVKKPRKVSEQTNSSRKTSNRPGRPSSKASSSKPAKRVHRESSSASSQLSEGSSSTSLKASSSKPAKRKHRESSSSDSSQQSFDEPPRLRGFSPNVSTDVSSPDISPTPSPKKSRKPSSPKLQKPQKPKRRLIISSDSDTSDDERHTRRNKFRDAAPAAKTHEMDLDFEAPSSVEPPSSGSSSGNQSRDAPAAKTHETDLNFEAPSSVEPPSSGSSSGNQSTSGFGGSQTSPDSGSPEPEPLRDVKVELEKTSPEPLRDVRVEPIDEETVYDQSTVVSESMIDNQLAIPRPIEQRTPEKLQNIHQGQHYVGMALTHTTIIDSRLVNCDVQNSTIINCVIQNSSISNSRVTSQII